MIAGTTPTLLPVIEPCSTNPANDVAKRLTGRDYVSWSAISTFRTCPLKYKFRYIDGLPEESVSAALIFGTGIHTAIEQHFQSIPSPNSMSYCSLTALHGCRMTRTRSLSAAQKHGPHWILWPRRCSRLS